MIPKIIHQIWVGDFKIPYREKQLTQKIKEYHPNFDYIFWTDAPSLPRNIQFWYDEFYKIKNYAFCADLLRLWAIKEYGGFYLDIDFDPSNSLDDFLQNDGLILYHNNSDMTVPNNVFAAKPNLSLLNFCIEEIKTENNWYGPSWLGATVKKYLNLPYEVTHDEVKQKLKQQNIEYFAYNIFEEKYARHMSLYSWSPEVWEKLNKGEQL